MFRCGRRRVVVGLMAACIVFGVAAQPPSPVTKTVTVSGNIAQPLTLTVDDLSRYPAHQVEYTPGDAVEKQPGAGVKRHYVGALLRDVLAAAKPVEKKPRELRRSYVVATASDGYQVVFSWAELFISPVGDSVFVVYDRDGSPLADDEGRIALLAVTDTRPARHVKWLQSLQLRVVDP